MRAIRYLAATVLALTLLMVGSLEDEAADPNASRATTSGSSRMLWEHSNKKQNNRKLARQFGYADRNGRSLNYPPPYPYKQNNRMLPYGNFYGHHPPYYPLPPHPQPAIWFPPPAPPAHVCFKVKDSRTTTRKGKNCQCECECCRGGNYSPSFDCRCGCDCMKVNPVPPLPKYPPPMYPPPMYPPPMYPPPKHPPRKHPPSPPRPKYPPSPPPSPPPPKYPPPYWVIPFPRFPRTAFPSTYMPSSASLAPFPPILPPETPPNKPPDLPTNQPPGPSSPADEQKPYEKTSPPAEPSDVDPMEPSEVDPVEPSEVAPVEPREVVDGAAVDDSAEPGVFAALESQTSSVLQSRAAGWVASCTAFTATLIMGTIF